MRYYGEINVFFHELDENHLEKEQSYYQNFNHFDLEELKKEMNEVFKQFVEKYQRNLKFVFYYEYLDNQFYKVSGEKTIIYE